MTSDACVDVVTRTASKAVQDAMRKIAVAMENGEYDFDGTKDKQVRRHSAYVARVHANP